jgi:hypothetical protein
MWTELLASFVGRASRNGGVFGRNVASEKATPLRKLRKLVSKRCFAWAMKRIKEYRDATRLDGAGRWLVCNGKEWEMMSRPKGTRSGFRVIPVQPELPFEENDAMAFAGSVIEQDNLLQGAA